jgi:tetratricopeptide (TPR) repeat protein
MTFTTRSLLPLFLSLLSIASTAIAETIAVHDLSLAKIVRRDPAADPQQLEVAVKTFETGDYEGTLNRLEEACRANAELPPPELMLARMFLAVGRLDTVSGLLEQVARERPEYPGTYNTFGELALQQGRVADALAQFTLVRLMLDRRKVRQRERFESDCLLGLAAVAELRGQWDQAAKYLRVVLEADEAMGPAHYRLGIAEFYRGEQTSAVKHLRRGRELDGSLPVAELALSRLYDQTGNREQAEAWMMKAVERHPTDPMVRTAQANWLLKQGEDTEAYQAAKEANALNSDDRNVRYTLGIAARQLRRFEEAIDSFRQLYQNSPNDLEALNQLALCLAEQEDPAARRQALQFAESLVRQTPQDRRAYATLGWCHYRNENLSQAKQALMTSISGGEGPAVSGYYLACVLRDLGEAEKIPELLAAAANAEAPFSHRAEVSEWLAQLDVAQAE